MYVIGFVEIITLFYTITSCDIIHVDFSSLRSEDISSGVE